MQNLCTLVLVVAAFTNSGCAQEKTYPELGSLFAGPIDVVASPSGNHFYVLNSDLDLTYGKGSVLTLDSTGQKIGAISTPRLGNFLERSGDLLIAGFGLGTINTTAQEQLKAGAQTVDIPGSRYIQLYDISDESSPQFKKEFEIGCNPINAVKDQNNSLFAVTCVNGDLYVGNVNEDIASSELQLVRSYGWPTKRAMYLDMSHQLLLMFPTDLGEQSFTDLLAADTIGYDASTESVTAGANEAPDAYEETETQRKMPSSRIYQYIALDLSALVSSNYQYRSYRSEDTDELAAIALETRWLYFNLNGIDGTPDQPAASEGLAGIASEGVKFYRTNFWQTQPAPYTPDTFYMSQRSGKGALQSLSNNILKVSIIGPSTDSEGEASKTEEFLKFERIYGFKGEASNESRHLPGDFEVLSIKGESALLVNHFKDVTSSSTEKSYFSIAARPLSDQTFQHSEISTDSPAQAYYRIALNTEGIGFSCSFYGNSVIRFEVEPGIAIKESTERVQ
jgi:hypothetical protein